MLLYYPFWMFMGFTLHFYIIFGTNLLTWGPARIAVFFAYFSVLKKRNIKRSPNGMKPLAAIFLEQPQSRGLGVDVKQQTRRPRGREARLGGRWYVSNVSIIFYCSMLLYYPFWMFMGFTLHFYNIFGTNLLTGGPSRIAVFLPISVFRRKGISNGVQMEWNLRERSFWKKLDPEDFEWKSRNKGGGHEGAQRAP